MSSDSTPPSQQSNQITPDVLVQEIEMTSGYFVAFMLGICLIIIGGQLVPQLRVFAVSSESPNYALNTLIPLSQGLIMAAGSILAFIGLRRAFQRIVYISGELKQLKSKLRGS